MFIEFILIHSFFLLVLFLAYRSYFPLAYRKARASKRRYIVQEHDWESGAVTHHACTHNTMLLFQALDKEEDYPFSFKVVKRYE